MENGAMELTPKNWQDQKTEYDRVFKIILVGDPETGKSHITSRFCRNEFSDTISPTVVMEYTRKTMIKQRVSVQIMDLAGRDVFRSVTTAYYKGAVGAIVVYDITKIRSFENAERWIDSIRDSLGCDSPVILLLGNKLDLRHHRSVTTEDGHNLARSKKTLFFEASAKDGTNIQKAFNYLVDHVKENFTQTQLKRDVGLGAGLERGAQALSYTKRDCKSPVSVVQTQPKSKYSLRDSAQRCLEGAKESCCSKFYCCM